MTVTRADFRMRGVDKTKNSILNFGENRWTNVGKVITLKSFFRDLLSLMYGHSQVVGVFKTMKASLF